MTDFLAYARKAPYSSKRRLFSRFKMRSETLITVRSGCECLVGLSIVRLPDVAVPVHVKQHRSRQSLVLTQHDVAIEQHEREVLHDLVKRLMVLSFREDTQLELVNG